MYLCTHPGCDKIFRKLSKMRIHLMSHTGERPFKVILLIKNNVRRSQEINLEIRFKYYSKKKWRGNAEMSWKFFEFKNKPTFVCDNFISCITVKSWVTAFNFRDQDVHVVFLENKISKTFEDWVTKRNFHDDEAFANIMKITPSWIKVGLQYIHFIILGTSLAWNCLCFIY